MGREEMLSYKWTVDVDWTNELGSHCTDYIQLAFISSCLSVFVGGIIMILTFRIIEYGVHLCFSDETRKSFSSNFPLIISWTRHFQDWVVMMISAQTSVGRVLVILVFLFSIGSLIIYFINCYSVQQFCLSFEDQTLVFDLFFNLFFLVYFGMRFLAASDKLAFWLELNSIVDFFTITPVCISFYIGRNWLGLRFLRALRLVELPKILQFLHITTTGTAVKLSKLLAVFVSTWLTAAGFLHWMENSGDPWARHANSQNLTYFECLYLIMVTMSTVGYGDIVIKTDLGRIFILFFIVGGLILFANLVPEMADIVASTKIYKGSYVAVKGKKFIIVTGAVTLNSVTSFLKDFLSQATGVVATEIVFLGEQPPSLEMETVFRCYAAYTSFFQGTVMKTEDLMRIRMDIADACVILADSCSPDPYIEDTANIMRVLSIKNHFPTLRVIIQILQSTNKVYPPRLPNWNWLKGDSILCFSELKLGLIAQSCLVPGLTTLLTSLFIREDIQKQNTKAQHRHEIEGQEYKVRTQLLSNDFVGMAFRDVCSIFTNPPSTIKLHMNTMGFFIARSAKELHRALYFCKHCHRDVTNPDLITKCRCRMKVSRKGFSIVSEKLKAVQEYLIHVDQPSKATEAQRVKSIVNEPEEIDSGPEATEAPSNSLLDFTGMFHWCEAVPFEKIQLKQNKRFLSQLNNHIVVCVFGDANSSLIGLRNFVMPLRASNLSFGELKDIVFVGSPEYLQKEWEFIQNFPKLYILKGTGLSCSDLKAANIKNCIMCAILSAHAKDTGDQALVDSQSILATLNIRSLQFLDMAVSREASTAAEAQIQEAPEHGSQRMYSKRIPTITELKVASNAQFFSPGEVDESYSTSGQVQVFTRGTVFSDSFLDSLLCTTYHNHHVLALLQTLVTGGISPELDEYLSEQNTLLGSFNSLSDLGGRDRCKLALLPVTMKPISPPGLTLYFGDIFTKALDQYGILCFALYRMKEDGHLRENRYVIVRPNTISEILPSDQIFCFLPYNTHLKDLSSVIKTIAASKRNLVLKQEAPQCNVKTTTK